LKIQLTIGEDYCPKWDLFCGVREFMQNARDAINVGCVSDYVYLPGENTIKIRTTGTTLGHKTLLLGESSKRGSPDMLGYKIGSLVLCRLGKGVKIRTGSELWVPAIQMSKSFGAKILCFDIIKGKKDLNEIAVEITGVTQEEWDSIKWKFLFIDGRENELIRTPVGDCIIDGDGHIFVQGIWVCHMEKFIHGYNFMSNRIALDRDRGLVDSWETNNLTSAIWESLYLNDSKEHCDLVDSMLASEAEDVSHFKFNFCVGLAARKKIAKRFIEKYGSESIAVKSESEARESVFYGKKGKVVSSDVLREILESQIGTIDSVKRSVESQVTGTYSSISLTPVESKNFVMALEFVSKSLKKSGFNITKDISIVSFANPAIMGMRTGSSICLSRSTLRSFEEALKTLVEEVAHEYGADGTRDHVERMHEIYANGVTAILIEGSNINYINDSGRFDHGDERDCSN
jgi:hypothetical protein